MTGNRKSKATAPPDIAQKGEEVKAPDAFSIDDLISDTLAAESVESEPVAEVAELSTPEQEASSPSSSVAAGQDPGLSDALSPVDDHEKTTRAYRPSVPVIAGAAAALLLLIVGLLMLTGDSDSEGVEALPAEAVAEIWTCPDTNKTAIRDASVVACISLIRGDAQVQRGGAGTWNPIEAGSQLFDGDVLKATDDSKVQVALASGEVAEMQPGSQVAIVVQTVDGEDPAHQRVAKLELREGAVNATMKTGSQRNLFANQGVGDMVMEVAPGEKQVEYRMTARKDGALEVAVRKGAAKLTTRDGRSVQLVAGKAQDLHEGTLRGEVLELPDFPQLLSPGVDATKIYKKGESSVLKWKSVKGAASYRIEVAGDQGFTQLLTNTTTASTKSSFKPQAPGTYYWRVAALNASHREGEFGFTRRLYLVSSDTSEKTDYLLGPEDGTVIVYAGKRTQIDFSWRAVVADVPYKLVIGKRSDLMKRVVLSTKTRKQEITVSAPKPGEYFWGVYLDHSDSPTPLFTEPRALTVKTDASEHVPKQLKWK